MESASARAVPLGASFFWLWCFSTISISKPAPASTLAASWTSFNKRLTPKDILAERSTAVFSAVSFTFFICASESPVVQSTRPSFFSAQKSIRWSAAFGEAKSTTTSASSLHSSKDGYTGYPFSLSFLRSIPATMVRPSISFAILVMT